MYSVKAKSQLGNIWVKDIWQHKKVKATRYSARDLKNLSILPENSTEGLGSRKECCWHYVVSIFENTQTYLVVQRRVQLEHSSHIVKVGVEATCVHSILEMYWGKRPNRWAHLELCHRNHDILERVLNWIVLSNSTVGKCPLMQVIKQPEHGRTSIIKEHPPFRWTMINS